MMNFKDAFSIISQGQSPFTSIKNFIASEFPNTLKALKIIEQDC